MKSNFFLLTKDLKRFTNLSSMRNMSVLFLKPKTNGAFCKRNEKKKNIWRDRLRIQAVNMLLGDSKKKKKKNQRKTV